jgi:hypothetical protein
MNLNMKIKRLFLAGIITLALLLGTLGMANKLQVSNSTQMAGTVTTNGSCWKCTG